MPTKTIDDLRNALFAQLARLDECDTPEEIARAKAVAGIAQQINASAKIEVDFIHATGAKGSGFLPEKDTPPQRPGLGVEKPPMAMINNGRGRT